MVNFFCFVVASCFQFLLIGAVFKSTEVKPGDSSYHWTAIAFATLAIIMAGIGGAYR